jgi:hypothetical protein
LDNWVQFVHKEHSGQNIQDQVLNGWNADGTPKTILGRRSSEVIKEVSYNKITLIFGYGNLNITPLISALIVDSIKQGDVLVGIPRQRYKHLNDIYQKNYFSLINGASRFFYNSTLWCSAKLDKNSYGSNRTVFDLGRVKTRPKWGMTDYKDSSEYILKRALENGEVNERSFIVTFPLTIGLPELMLENPVFRSNNTDYRLRPLNPRFLILESIDEVLHNMNPLISMIKILLNRDIGAVIHFSWPYQTGLEKFMEQLNKLEKNELEKISYFHFGRTICIKSKDSFLNEITTLSKEGDISSALNNHPSIKELSIEGRSWNSYYPETIRKINNHFLVCLVGDTIPVSDHLNSIVSEPTDIDELIGNLRQELVRRKLSGNIGYILSFLPFLDSFVIPSEFRVPFKINATFRSLPLRSAVENARSIANHEQKAILNRLLSLINRLSAVKDLSLSIQNLKTPNYLGKSTALMTYLLLRGSIEQYVEIIVCEYNYRVGFGYPSLNYFIKMLKEIKNRVPIKFKSLFREEFVLFNPITSKLIKCDYAQEILELDFCSSFTGHSVEVKIKSLMENGNIRVCKNKIIFENIASLKKNASTYDAENTELLLPGPIPLLSFEGGIPKITQGLDTILRPFRVVVFFSYFGENFSRIKNQLSILDGLLAGDTNNPIVAKDFAISKSLNNVLKNDHLNQIIPEAHESYEALKSDDLEDAPLDDAFRVASFDYEKMVNNENSKSLLEQWINISKANKAKIAQQSAPTATDLIKLAVVFDGMRNESNVWIRRGSYIRVVQNEDTKMTLSEELVPGLRIAYMETESRESLDNSFIRDYTSYRGLTLESILEPFECLKNFCNVLLDQDFRSEYDPKNYSRLKWLSEMQKEKLHSTLKFLIDPTPLLNNDYDMIKNYFKNNEIWPKISELSTSDLIELKRMFERNGVNDVSLFRTMTALGFDYEFASFKSMLRKLNAGKKHYYFEKSENLLALSLFIVHRKTEENYEELTGAGKEIRIVLQLVGKSIQRVIRGEIGTINEMDNRIRDSVKLCKITKVF